MDPDLAVKISEKTQSMIAAVNDGETPEVRKTVQYFVLSGRPHQYNLILAESNFRRNFRFIGEESEDEFNEVREI